MTSNERLVQVFLSESSAPGPGIFEVSWADNGRLSCTCPSFSTRKQCKHTKFVEARLESNNGNYPLEILSKATEAEAAKAKLSKEEYRQFIIKYGKIEVF